MQCTFPANKVTWVHGRVLRDEGLARHRVSGRALTEEQTVAIHAVHKSVGASTNCRPTLPESRVSDLNVRVEVQPGRVPPVQVGRMFEKASSNRSHGYPTIPESRVSDQIARAEVQPGREAPVQVGEQFEGASLNWRYSHPKFSMSRVSNQNVRVKGRPGREPPAQVGVRFEGASSN